MATVDLGAIRFNWKGAYSGGTAYVVDDVVSSGGSSYMCIQAHAAGTQAVSVTAYWSIMSSAGTDGTDVGTTITTQGDLLYRDGSGLQRLAKGTAGQALKVNAGATAPEWGGVTAGLSTIWVPAVAMYPTSTLGCEATAQVEITAQRPEIKALDFKTAADAYAQFAIAFPKSWDRLALQYQTYWSVTGTDVNTVVFELAAVAISSDDPMNPVFGTPVANTGLAASGTANDLMVNVKSGDVTVGGTPAEGDQVFFQIMRDVSAGTQAADVRLLGVKLFFTTNAENDA
tara:strand:- start:17 stop:874 length:858 start_codon:yes stop_codon:yes gene_type:complete